MSSAILVSQHTTTLYFMKPYSHLKHTFVILKVQYLIITKEQLRLVEMQKKNIFFTYIQIRHLEGVLRWVSFFLSFFGVCGGYEKDQKVSFNCLSLLFAVLHTWAAGTQGFPFPRHAIHGVAVVDRAMSNQIWRVDSQLCPTSYTLTHGV